MYRKSLGNLNSCLDLTAPLINQLIRKWQNDNDMMKLCTVLSKKKNYDFFFLDYAHSRQYPAWRLNKAIPNFEQLQMPEPKAHGGGR